MKVLVTGRHGQLAQSLAECGRDLDFVFAGRPDCDLAQLGSLAAAISTVRPDIVINAAAFTAVDRAEEEQAHAWRVNSDAAEEGAIAAAALDIPFVQLSTDFVFSGSSDRPWREDDRVSPINVYGETKAEGERRVLSASERHVVVRTSWVVGPFGQNFAKTILNRSETVDVLRVVDDQRGCPTGSLDLAEALIGLVAQAVEGGVSGVWHLAGAGSATWAELAEEVLAASLDHGGPWARVERIATNDFPTPAARPKMSVLDCSKAGELLGLALPMWRESVRAFVPRILEGHR